MLLLSFLLLTIHGIAGETQGSNGNASNDYRLPPKIHGLAPRPGYFLEPISDHDCKYHIHKSPFHPSSSFIYHPLHVLFVSEDPRIPCKKPL